MKNLIIPPLGFRLAIPLLLCLLCLLTQFHPLSAQNCPVKTNSLSMVNFTWNLVPVAGSNGTQTDLVLHLNGKWEGMNFAHFMGLKAGFKFSRAFHPSAKLSLIFKGWLNQPQQFSDFLDFDPSRSKVLLSLGNESCIPLTGQGELLRIRIDNQGMPVYGLRSELIPGGIVIEDIMPAQKTQLADPTAELKVGQDPQGNWLSVSGGPSPIQSVRMRQLTGGTVATYSGTTGEVRMATSHLPGGIYLLEVTHAEGEHATRKVYLAK